ncbi:MAG: DnaA N-terminal domain-containing protein, partial [Lutispora sp.]|nr:DnaA N-terminal domain-containing protein [Lutispora sp.]
MNDIISHILTDLNFIKKAVGRIEEGLSILESNVQLSVEVYKKFEEFSDIENNAADVSVFNNLDCIWRSVLDIVKKELTEISYKTWLEIIVPLSIDQNKIRLGVPGEFEKGIIG